MKEEFESGIAFLEGILQNWIKGKKSDKSKKYYIFFPKCQKVNDINYILFPIFEEQEDGKLKLKVWGKYDLQRYALIGYDNEKEEIIIDDKNLLDYKNSKFKDAIVSFLYIFYVAQRFINLTDESVKYVANLELLEDKIDEYDENLKKILKDEDLWDIYGIKKRDRNAKKEETKEESKVEDDEVTENKIVAETQTDSNLLTIPKEFNSKVEKYEFEWNTINGLRYVSDKALEIAFRLIKDGMISIKYLENEKTKKAQIAINSNITTFCDYKTTTEELLDALKTDKKKLDNRDIFNKSRVVWKIDVTRSIDMVCLGCKLDKCPKIIAAYILYLYGKGQLEEKLKDREEFRKNNSVNDKFDFNWNVEDGLKKVDDETYNFAKELVKRGAIFVNNTLTPQGLIKINTLYSCSEYKTMNNEIEKIISKKNDIRTSPVILRAKEMKFKLCNTYECSLKMCPIEVAGYIYYLQRLGKLDQIEKDREYYKANKKEIDKQIEIDRQNKLKELEELKNNYLNSLNDFSDKVSNVKDISDNIFNKSQRNFHCIIEGGDDDVKTRLIMQIANMLFKNGKIISNNIIRISMQNLAARNAYTANQTFKELDKYNVPYFSEKEIRYTELKERVLFEITDVEEFLSDYRNFKSKTTDIKYKQFKHALDLLTRMDSQNYIIINSNKKAIDELLEIEPKLKFIYQNYRYEVKDLSIDEIFDIYVSKIKSELIGDLREHNDEYKKQFEEYVTLNKNFIPFSSRELADYLASYSNSKGKIVFPENMYKKETVEESLKNIIGLDSLKEKVREFEKYMLFQIKAKSSGLKLSNTNMHMLFTGNPGTGKTTIARIMAKMLFDLGIIKENKLIEVERKDLIGQYVGQTAPKTAEVIEKAMGGVLFIDEAYSLTQGSGNGNSYGLEAIATIIKAMEDHKGEFVVIFAGYKDEMKTFLDSNSGIASRIGYTFDFPDYTPKELVQMFMLKMKNMGFQCDKDIEVEITNICDYYSKRKAFGNGRFVDKLMQEVIMKHAINDNSKINEITKADIPTIEDLNNTKMEEHIDLDKELENIIGMKEVKEKIKEFEQYAKFVKRAQNNNINLPNQNMHMLFTGNPGTGKTTIARIMAKMLSELGIIHENKLIEVEKKDLVAQYVGQTAPKTSEVIEKAMGGVLFIDEAYSLTEGKDAFGQEAIATLIKAMEDHKGEFVVIFAGYKKEMKDFVDSNPGIASRIGYTFDFADYDEYELAEILYRKIDKCDLEISKEAKDAVAKIMKYFWNVENIGNGRFTDKVLQEILMKHAKNNPKNIKLLTEEDIPTVQEMTEVVFNGSGMIDPSTISEETSKRVAIHEVGHAITRLILFKKPGIKRITINAEGNGALGYVLHSTDPEKHLETKNDIMNELQVLVGGMAAEQVYLGEFSNGNSSDLEKATKIVRRMVRYSGMSSLGFGQIFNLEGEMEKEIQTEVNKILEEAFNGAVEIIKENKKKMDNVVKYLIKNREITEEEFVENFK